MGSRNTENKATNFNKEIEDLKKEIQGYRDERLVAVCKITSCFADLEEEYHEYPDPISQMVDFCGQLYQERQRWNLEVQRCNEEKGDEIWRQKQELAEKDRELGDIKMLLLEKDREIDEVKKLLLETDNKARTERSYLEEKFINCAEEMHRQEKYFKEKLQRQHEHYTEQLRNHDDARTTGNRDILDSLEGFGFATDDGLMMKYVQVNSLINDLAETYICDVAKIQAWRTGWGGAGPLARDRTPRQRFLLPSIIWSILVEGFFSMPYGFGLLGSGSGPRELFHAYLEWLRLYGEGVDTSCKSRRVNAPLSGFLT